MLLNEGLNGIMEKTTSTFSALLDLEGVQLSFLSSLEGTMFLLLFKT